MNTPQKLTVILAIFSSIASPYALAFTKDPPYTISRTSPDPASVCYYDNEGVAPMIHVGASTPHHFLAYSGAGFNRTFFYTEDWEWRTWAPQEMLVPNGASVSLGGDAWATSSANLQFASFLADSMGRTCVAIAATNPTDLNSNIWTYPAQCILTPSGADGPIIAADPRGFSNNFYATWLEFLPPSFRFASMPNCTQGPIGCCADGSCNSTNCPGESGCPVTYSGSLTNSPNSPVSTHPAVTVNPCTGNAAVVYWNGSNGAAAVYLEIRQPNGTKKFNGAIVTNLSHARNSVCTSGDFRRCGNGTNCGSGGYGECSRTAAVPQIAIDREGTTCRAYVTYDQSFFVDGGQWFRSYLDIYDLGTVASPKEGGNTPNPVFLKRWVSSPDWYGAWNNYQPTISISSTSSNVGWFWYEDGTSGPCGLNYVGAIDSANALINLSSTGPLNDTPFPQLEGLPHSLTDYTVGTISSDSWLYATWIQSVPTQASCALCSGQNYSTVVKRARVLP